MQTIYEYVDDANDEIDTGADLCVAHHSLECSVIVSTRLLQELVFAICFCAFRCLTELFPPKPLRKPPSGQGASPFPGSADI